MRRCLGLLWLKMESKAPFLTTSPFEAVRDALTGRRSAVRTATKTQRCDL